MVLIDKQCDGEYPMIALKDKIPFLPKPAIVDEFLSDINAKYFQVAKNKSVKLL